SYCRVDEQNTEIIRLLKATQVKLEDNLSVVPDQLLYASSLSSIKSATADADDSTFLHAPRTIPEKEPNFYLSLIRASPLLNTPAAAALYVALRCTSGV